MKSPSDPLKQTLREILEEVNEELRVVGDAIAEDLYERLMAGLSGWVPYSPIEVETYRDWVKEVLEDVLCNRLASDEKCSELASELVDSVEVEASISIKLRLRYVDLVRALARFIDREARG